MKAWFVREKGEFCAEIIFAETRGKAKHKADTDPYLPIFILDGDNDLPGEVTHWQPLPAPPTEKPYD